MKGSRKDSEKRKIERWNRKNWKLGVYLYIMLLVLLAIGIKEALIKYESKVIN